MSKVVLCVCTCRRPDGLKRLLHAVADLDFTGELAVVLVENDAAQEGLAVCHGLLEERYRWPLTCVIEEQPGIPFARNHAVRVALEQNPDFIAMLDDDEWPSRQWLDKLLRVQAKTDADVVGGPQVPVLPPDTSLCAGLTQYYGCDQRLSDGASCVLYSSGNFLARSNCFKALMPTPFDPTFTSGAEDVVFFRRLAERGYRMHWSATGMVYEEVPPDRASIGWLKRRQVRTGNANVIVQRMFAPGLDHEAVRLAKTAGLLTVSATFYAVSFPHRLSRVRASLLLSKAKGKVMGHLGCQLKYTEHGG